MFIYIFVSINLTRHLIDKIGSPNCKRKNSLTRLSSLLLGFFV